MTKKTQCSLLRGSLDKYYATPERQNGLQRKATIW